MRLEKLDILRGIAIVLMVLFHLNYSLVFIFSYEVFNFSYIFWFILGKIAVLLFIFIAGISFLLAENKYGDKIIKKYLKVSLYLGIIAGIISISTYIFFEQQYIRFGIIHFFTLSFILMLLFRKFKYYNILLGIIIIVYGVYFLPIIENKYLYFLGFMYPGFVSSDYYAIFPYFGVMLLGYSFALYLYRIGKLDIFKLKSRKILPYKVLEYLGKKSLIIYLIHQPIIIGFIYLFEYLNS